MLRMVRTRFVSKVNTYHELTMESIKIIRYRRIKLVCQSVYQARDFKNQFISTSNYLFIVSTFITMVSSFV